mgnify:CR=1 FL=1
MIDLVTSVPITPGSLGQTELAAIIVFSLLNIPNEISIATILLVQLITYWTFLIVSWQILHYLGLSKLLDKLNLKKLRHFINN